MTVDREPRWADPRPQPEPLPPGAGHAWPMDPARARVTCDACGRATPWVNVPALAWMAWLLVAAAAVVAQYHGEDVVVDILAGAWMAWLGAIWLDA